jgi:NAD(P)-dependent dehydrogenase (short-subunit alcohol dehydrogenase family)
VSLAGRQAVVTGGASGIGRSICLRLARDGADVAILDLEAAPAVVEEVRALGRRALAVQADVSSSTDVGLAVERVHRELGPVQILVNDAGIANFVAFLQMTEEQWDRMIAVHLKGTFNCTRAILPDMMQAGWGRIVNISSVGGLRGAPALTHYAAAKAGIIGFTKALAIEVGSHGITANAIAPGLIDTPLLRRSAMPEAMIRSVAAQAPVGRIGSPEDVAAACGYLVSEEASFVTGQVLSPNGGGYL